MQRWIRVFVFGSALFAVSVNPVDKHALAKNWQRVLARASQEIPEHYISRHFPPYKWNCAETKPYANITAVALRYGEVREAEDPEDVTSEEHALYELFFPALETDKRRRFEQIDAPQLVCAWELNYLDFPDSQLSERDIAQVRMVWRWGDQQQPLEMVLEEHRKVRRWESQGLGIARFLQAKTMQMLLKTLTVDNILVHIPTVGEKAANFKYDRTTYPEEKPFPNVYPQRNYPSVSKVQQRRLGSQWRRELHETARRLEGLLGTHLPEARRLGLDSETVETMGRIVNRFSELTPQHHNNGVPHSHPDCCAMSANGRLTPHPEVVRSNGHDNGVSLRTAVPKASKLGRTR
jgi:hypothetical protein